MDTPTLRSRFMSMIPDFSRLLNIWRSLLFVTAITAVLAGVDLKREQHERESQTAEWLRLHGLLSDRDYEDLLARLKAAADSGDAESQRLLGVALLVGPEPFQASHSARLCEARYWLMRSEAMSIEGAYPTLALLDRMRLDCDASPAGSRSPATD